MDLPLNSLFFLKIKFIVFCIISEVRFSNYKLISAKLKQVFPLKNWLQLFCGGLKHMNELSYMSCKKLPQLAQEKKSLFHSC